MKENLTHWLVLVNHYWGSGASRSEALKNCRKESGRKPSTYLVYRVAPGTFVNEMGYLCWSGDLEGNRPELVEAYKNGKPTPLKDVKA